VGKKSIYVSISCLGVDTELERTINSCLAQASGENDINIGVAFISNYDFYKSIIKNIPNIQHTYSTLKEDFGIGSHRRLAASMYKKEDFFLQIDAHSYFKKDWDKFLINRFENISSHIGEKIVLTAYAGSYGYEYNLNQNSINIYDNSLGYTEWIPKKFRVLNDTIPMWQHVYLKNTPKQFLYEEEINIYDEIEKNGFCKIDKISAHFIFGKGNIYSFMDDQSNILFWEEEIIHSINLVNNGFTLIYPGFECYIYHLYSQHITDDIGKRENFIDVLQKENIKIDVDQTIKDNFLLYLMKNPVEVEIYQKYANIDLITGNNIF